MKRPNHRSLLTLTALSALTLLTGQTAQANSYFDEVLADNPIAYYRLGESSGTTANDASPNNNDGTYVGTVTKGTTGALSPTDTDTATTTDGGVNPGRVDAAALFDPAATNFTIELWLNVTNIAEAKGVVSQTNGSGLGRSVIYLIDNSGGLGGQPYGVSSFLGGVDTFSGFGTLNLGTWYHIALVATDNGATSSLQWYLNGVAATFASGINIEAADGNFVLHAVKDGSGVLNGTLDEVAFYTTALSGSRILEHYNSRFQTTSPVIPEPASLAMLLAGSALIGSRSSGRRGNRACNRA